MTWNLGRLENLREQGVSIHTINQRDVVVLADGENFYAFDRICPHAKGDLAKARFSGDSLVCINHGLKFRLRDGSLDLSELDDDLRESLGPQASDAFRLRVYPTRIQGNCLWLDTE